VRPREATAGRGYGQVSRPTGLGHPARQLADLGLRHRRRARAEDRIRNAKDTGLASLALHDFT
jgi:hypothetical protein